MMRQGYFCIFSISPAGKRNPAAPCSELTEKVSPSLTTGGELPQASPRRQAGQWDSGQAGQTAGRAAPYPADGSRVGINIRWVQVEAGAGFPGTDSLQQCREGHGDDGRSSPRRRVAPIPHTEEQSEPGYCRIGLTGRLTATQLISVGRNRNFLSDPL